MAKIRKSKIVKYAGLTLAAFLAFGVISALAAFLSTEDLSKVEMKEVSLEQTNITSLEVELGGMEFALSKGDTLSASTNNEDLKFIQKDGKLKIVEDDGAFNRKINGKLVLTLPETTLESAEIETGAGKVEIESLTAKTLDFQFGAGEVTIERLVVTERAQIETGAGKFSVLGGEIKNLDLDLGVGETIVCCDLFGESEVSCGVGEVKIELSSLTDYTITLNKGLGSIEVAGVERKNGSVVGDGANKLQIDGGIGAIKVSFVN